MQRSVSDAGDDAAPATIARYLLRHLDRDAPSRDAPALIGTDGVLSWAQVAERGVAAATALTASGSATGDRVAFVIDPVPSPESCIGLFAAALAGLVVVPVNARFTPHERDAVLAAAAPDRVVEADELVAAVTGSGAGDVAAVTRSAGTRGADDDLVIVCSSGTTGAAKGVRCTNRNVLASAVAVNAALGVTATDRWLCCLPLVHVGAMSILWRAVVAGCAVVPADPSDPDPSAGAATVASLVPTQLHRFVRDGVAVPGPLRCVLLGGAGVGAALYADAVAAGWPVRPSYGLSEMCSTVAIAPASSASSAHVPSAVVLDGVTCVVRDGHVLLDGPMRSPGHAWGPPAPEHDVDGRRLLDTGDRGVLDADGTLRIVGRADAMFVVGGENVHPEEIEAVLLSHPAVAAVRVHGAADDDKGQVPVAAVVAADAEPTPDPDELRTYCRERLAAYKVPVHVELVADLPRTSSGKIRRGP